jgi:plastocyanin
VTHPRRTIALAAAALLLPASAFAAGTKTVAVKDDVFAARSITVSQGTRVRWVWKGDRPHNVTVTKGPVRFRSSTRTYGSFARTLEKKGTYVILCTIHQPDMRMTVVVR